ncbi:hypothetical protein EV715DRAFT_295360 [Schizophyllum commune]
MPSYFYPASMHCAPHAQDRGADGHIHPNSRGLATPSHNYICTAPATCIPLRSRTYHPSALPPPDALPYTRSRDPRSMTTSELPAYTKAWEERERRGSVDSMRSDASGDDPREPGSSAVPWLPQHASHKSSPLEQSAPAYEGWYQDVVERLAAGESMDPAEFGAILEKEVAAAHAPASAREGN